MKRTIRKGRLGIVVGTLAALGVGTVAAHEIQYRRQSTLLLNQADELVKNGNKSAAIQFYQQYLNFRPKDCDALLKYAETLEGLGNLKTRDRLALIDIYERIVLIDDSPRYAERKKLVDLLMNYQFYSNARIHLQALESAKDQSFKDDSKLWIDLARCELGESKFKKLDSAIGYLRRAIECKGNPAEPETYHDLAKLLRFEVKTKPAIAEADSIIKDLVTLRPNDTKARLVRARYLISTGQAVKAKEDIEFVRKTGGDGDPEAMLAVAKIDMGEGKYESAKEMLQSAITPIAFSNLAKTKKRLINSKRHSS
jgi:cellulose synthase operon protein C